MALEMVPENMITSRIFLTNYDAIPLNRTIQDVKMKLTTVSISPAEPEALGVRALKGAWSRISFPQSVHVHGHDHVNVHDRNFVSLLFGIEIIETMPTHFEPVPNVSVDVDVLVAVDGF